MESQLWKFLSPRRHKARRRDATTELDLHSIPYTTATSQGRLPVLINHALGKSAAVEQPKSGSPREHLRSFSYEEATPGTPPELGNRPHRGNGPVKLQTSRRLSSGELLVTQQDYERTLEEIREGEYIVGGKERRTSRTSSQPKSPTDPPNLKFISTAPSSPREQVAFSGATWKPPSVSSDVPPVASRPSAASNFNLPQRSSSAHGFYSEYSQHLSGNNGLRISNTAQQHYPRLMASTTSLLEPNEEQNPTIQALWKAEYSRLVSIYGQAGVNRTIVELNRDPGGAPVPHQSFMNCDTSYLGSSLSLNQPIHRPISPVRFGLGLKTYVSTSNLDLTYRDDHSDWSSHPRYSHLSSSGTSSSITTGTSVAEESGLSRDNIRKIVDDMRTTYLHAIEAHTPPLQPLSDPPVRKPRSKKQTPSLMSYASVDGSLRSASRQSTTRTKSWQSNTTNVNTPRTSISSPMIKSKRTSSATSRRTSSQHVAGIATLTPIQASPAKSAKSNRTKKNDDDVGLKRADSTTLGVMARKLTIVDDRNSISSSQPTFTSSPTFYNSSGSDSESGPENLSPSSPPKSSSIKASSVQHTPEKLHKPAMRHRSPLAKQPWQIDVDQILPDDLELALEVDDFETLCDSLFNSPVSTDNGQLGIFQTWGGSETATSDSFSHDAAIVTDRPAELRTSKLANDQMSLGLTGLPAMI